MKIIIISDTHGRHRSLKLPKGDLLIHAGDVRMGRQPHVFGHIHEDYGQYTKDDTTFVNASVLDDRYQLVHQPVVIDFHGKSKNKA